MPLPVDPPSSPDLDRHQIAALETLLVERDREIQARMRAQRALDDSSQRLQLIVDSVPGLISYVDADGRYALVNGSYRDWFGADAVFVGRHVRDVVGEAAWAVAAPRLAQALAGQRVTYENQVRLVDGRVRDALTTYTPHRGHQGAVVGVIAQVTDITDHKQADREQRFLWALAETTQSLADAADVVRTTARLLAEHLDVDRCAYAEVLDGAVFDITGDHARGVPSIVGRWPVRAFGEACERLMHANQAYVVHDVDADPRVRGDDLAAYRATAIAAVICVPLHKDGLFTAAMAVHSATARPWSPADIDLVRHVVARCWESLERIRAARRLQESEAQYRALFESLDEGFLLADVLRDETGRVVDLLYLHANPAAERMVGSDFRGRRLLEIDPTYEPYWLEIWGRVADTGQGERHRLFAAPLARWFNFYVFPAGNEPGRVAVLFQDVTQEKRSEDALRARDARHAYIVDLADALRPLADPEQIERTTTRHLARHLGVSRAYYVQFDEAAGTGHIVRDHVDDGTASIAGVYAIVEWTLLARLRAGRPVAVDDVTASDLVTLREVPQYAALDIRAMLCVPLVKDGRLVASLVAAHRDVRRWHESEVTLVEDTAERTWSALERARAEAALRVADRRKDEFLATLAHELRNPLAPLRNGLQIARMRGRDDAVQTRTIDMMDRQLAHLVRLVDDLLDVGRIHAGKIALKREPVVLQEALASSMELSRVLLETHAQRLVTRLDDDDLVVVGDFDRLVQVFNNLLSNAAKYSNGPGDVTVDLERDGASAVVRVVDGGIGIPASELDHVFDLFSQVRSHQGKSEGGLGIGLSLVRDLVAQHGGTVTARSAGIGTGSTFTLRLPLSGTVTPRRPEAARTGPDPAVPSRRILVVDDNVDAAESLVALLDLLGHTVRIAHDGPDALAVAEAFQPAVVFLDLGMPGMDGLEVARRLRARPATAGALIVAMTGWGQHSDQQRTAAAGFDHHLVKPADLRAIERLLSGSGVGGAVAGGVDGGSDAAR